MLKLNVPEGELFDESKSEFIIVDETSLVLEHSLVSLSKWESIWERPFLSEVEKSNDETMSYIECMTLTPNVPKILYTQLDAEALNQIRDYIDAKMTATTFSELPGANKGTHKAIITSELIYFWMITYNIPFECQHWHLNRLMTLIKICDRKNQPNKKVNKAEISAKYRDENLRRRAALGTNG